MQSQELLHAMEGLLDRTLQKALEEKIAPVACTVSELKEEISELKSEVSELSKEMTSIKHRLNCVELTAENELHKNIQLLVEGHLDHTRKLDDVASAVIRTEEKVSVLEMMATSNREEIETLKQAY